MDLFFKPDVAMIKRTQLDWGDEVVIKIKEKED
jgi:hypothetical protein